MLRENDPRGTVEELEALGVDLAKVPSCSRRVIDDGQVVILGCREAKRCKLKEKFAGGVGETRKGGPVTKVLQILKKKPNGRVTVNTHQCYCFHIPGWQQRIEDEGGVLRVIGGEGETKDEFETRGSEVKSEMIAGQGMVAKVHEKVMTEKINPFPRPGTNGNLTEQLLVSQVMKAERERQAVERPAELLGLLSPAQQEGSTITPPGEEH